MGSVELLLCGYGEGLLGEGECDGVVGEGKGENMLRLFWSLNGVLCFWRDVIEVITHFAILFVL